MKEKCYSNNVPLSFKEKIAIETLIYNEQSIIDTIIPKKYINKDVIKREIEIFHDREYNIPQNIFTLK